MTNMTSRRPYLIRALYDWIVDNELTPHIVVDTTPGGCDVPEEHVKEDGKIILNISESAANHLYMDDIEVSFQCRFAGEPHNVRIPVGCIVGIYDRESGGGMVFGEPEPPELEEQEEPPRPQLRLVVDNDK